MYIYVYLQLSLYMYNVICTQIHIYVYIHKRVQIERDALSSTSFIKWFRQRISKSTSVFKSGRIRSPKTAHIGYVAYDISGVYIYVYLCIYCNTYKNIRISMYVYTYIYIHAYSLCFHNILRVYK